MKISIHADREKGLISPMLFGHFIEHFHRQVYGGVFDPGNPLSDADGMRTDVIRAMQDIHVPILRWPGGCFVSAYHWKGGVGSKRQPYFDKSWRVEEPNTFGTDEYLSFCRKVGCEPYICTNAGSGDAEEMSDWVEYCNLEKEGIYARQRIENGHEEPYRVRYWSVGNENYGGHEIGAKDTDQWGRLVAESTKMMIRIDPTIELSAAALPDINWTYNILKKSASRLRWLSIHEYWYCENETNEGPTYEQSMALTSGLDTYINQVRGLLMAMGLDKKIKIAFDEWNLRGWYHPNVFTPIPAVDKEDYLYPRDGNDDNSIYTMCDAVFSACFLNTCCRNCDIVGMANFAPIVNTRGCIYTYEDGIVLRPTYYVFWMYTNLLGDRLLDLWAENRNRLQVLDPDGQEVQVDAVDVIATAFSQEEKIAIAAVNKDPEHSCCLNLELYGYGSRIRIYTLNGDSPDSYNDIGHDGVGIVQGSWQDFDENTVITLPPHSVSIIHIAGADS